MGSVTRILTRQMYLCVHMRSLWFDRFFISSESLDEPDFVFGNIDAFNGHAIRKIANVFESNLL